MGTLARWRPHTINCGQSFACVSGNTRPDSVLNEGMNELAVNYTIYSILYIETMLKEVLTYSVQSQTPLVINI